MPISQPRIEEVLAFADLHKLKVMAENEPISFEELRDTAVALEQVDLDRAYTLMKFALYLRPNAPFPRERIELYENMRDVIASGCAEISGVTLSIDENVSQLIVRTLVTGNYENHELMLAKSNVCAQDTVLELGSGIGYLANAISPLCRKYIAYEANPNLIPLIKSSRERNNTTFEIRNGIVLNKAGEVSFYITPDFWASSLVKPEGEYTTVPIKSFNKNDVVSEIQPTVLIVDIEGGEYQFFKNLQCESVRKIVLEIHPDVLSDDELHETYQFLFDQGFKQDFKQSSKTVLYWYR